MNPSVLLASIHEPIRLVKGDEAGVTPMGVWVGGGLALCVGLAVLAWWAVAARRARVRRDEREYAFRALARAMGMPGGVRQLLRRRAAGAGAARLEHAKTAEQQQAAIGALEQSPVSKGDRRQLERLRRDFAL